MLLAALGGMSVEKTGLLHQWLEAMMALAAGIGFVSVYQTGSHGIGFVAETCASALYGCHLWRGDVRGPMRQCLYATLRRWHDCRAWLYRRGGRPACLI
jgi:hypothetical protein